MSLLHREGCQICLLNDRMSACTKEGIRQPPNQPARRPPVVRSNNHRHRDDKPKAMPQIRSAVGAGLTLPSLQSSTTPTYSDQHQHLQILMSPVPASTPPEPHAPTKVVGVWGRPLALLGLTTRTRRRTPSSPLRVKHAAKRQAHLEPTTHERQARHLEPKSASRPPCGF
jgi:hypothetical protein